MDENKKNGDAFGDFSVEDILKSIEAESESAKAEKNSSGISDQSPAVLPVGTTEIKGSLFDELKRNDAVKKGIDEQTDKRPESDGISAPFAEQSSYEKKTFKKTSRKIRQKT